MQVKINIKLNHKYAIYLSRNNTVSVFVLSKLINIFMKYSYVPHTFSHLIYLFYNDYIFIIILLPPSFSTLIYHNEWN